jgi:two-component system chemotaxis response regulator CheB
VPLAELGGLLYELARRPRAFDRLEPPATLQQEHAASTGGNAMQILKAIASPSVFTCPDCGGVLFELNDKCPVRLRCHTGHAFSLRSLAYLQEEVSDAALWTTLRVLQEKQAVLRRLAQAQAQEGAMPEVAHDALREANEIAGLCNAIRRLTQRAPGIGGLD